MNFDDVVIRRLVRAAVMAFAELNAIRARDGVPYTRNGTRSDVDEAYFSYVIDELDLAVRTATGKSAHRHPELSDVDFLFQRARKFLEQI